MENKRVKVLKTYGKHRSRVIRTDVWEDNIKTTKQSVFSGSSDLTPDDDFLSSRKTNLKKRKAKNSKAEHEKENRCCKEKNRISGDKLFADKDFVSSFSDSFKESSPGINEHLKKSTKRVVPPPTRKKKLPELTKIEVEYIDLYKSWRDKSLSMHFSDFDNYELCISESPCPANPHVKNFPKVTPLTTDSSDQLPETNDSISLLKNKRPEELCDDVLVESKAKRTKMVTSTPVVRLERSPEIDEHLHSLKKTDRNLEESRENGAEYSSMFSSPAWSGGYLAASRRSQKENNDNGNSLETYSSAKCSPYDCVVQLEKLDSDVEQMLSTDSYISCEGYSPNLFSDEKPKQNTSRKKQLSLLLSSCANCSLQQPCGNDCAYMKYMVSSRPIYDLGDVGDNNEFDDSSADLIGSSIGSRSKLVNDDDNMSNVFNMSIEHINSLLETVLLSSDEEISDDASDDSSSSMENNGELALNDIEEEEEEGDVRPKRGKYINDVTEEEDEESSSVDSMSPSTIHSGNQNKHLRSSSIVQRSPYETRGSKISREQKHGSKQTVANSVSSEKDEDDGDYDYYISHDDSGHIADNENSRSSHLSNGQMTTPSRKSLLVILSPIRCPISAKSKILKQCQQDRFISFTDFIEPDVMKKCVKIGEGVYGEVFRTSKHGKSVALKIIPIEGNFNVNECAQKNFGEMLPEIVISQELSELQFGIEDQTRNFISVNNVSCVKGKYPPQLLKQWDIFHRNKISDNDRPDIFSDDQLFVVFEFGDGGFTLEDFKLNNLRQARNILLQVVYSLAVAESALEFEHRDLHWGNVLVHPCPDDVINFSIKGIEMSLPLMGMEASIIDFTLSRLSKDDCTVFCDLAPDEELFQGSGDYQFHVYRMMRTETENQWGRFCPKTNVFWIHYLADKLLNCKTYEQCTRKDREILRGLRQFVSEVVEYKSAVDLVFSCDFMQITDE